MTILLTLWRCRAVLGLGVALLALGALIWSWHGRGQDLIAARQAEALASEIARGNARAVDAVTAMGERNVRAVSDAASAERARLLSRINIERRIADAPITHACADSPAVGAVLDGLRGRTAPPAQGGGTSDHGAGQPAILSAPTAAARPDG
jgi:hypothetical protein